MTPGFQVHSKVLMQNFAAQFGPVILSCLFPLPGDDDLLSSPHLRAGEEMVRQRLSLLPRVFYSHPVGGVSASLPIVRFGARGCSALRHFIAVAS